MKDKYYFGNLLLTIDFFSFPRTGSHLLFYCLSGLFDLIAYPHGHLENEEAISRQRELNPMVLYALDLRESGVPFQPLFVNAIPNDVHGKFKLSGNKCLVIIREPLSTVYSLYRVSTTRWSGRIQDTKSWARKQLLEYIDFYNIVFEKRSKLEGHTLIVKYEDLTASPEQLKNIVDFIGLTPKLSPEFVHTITKFETFVKGSERTFYREGSIGSWKKDPSWAFAEELAGEFDFSRFGY